MAFRRLESVFGAARAARRRWGLPGACYTEIRPPAGSGAPTRKSRRLSLPAAVPDEDSAGLRGRHVGLIRLVESDQPHAALAFESDDRLEWRLPVAGVEKDQVRARPPEVPRLAQDELGVGEHPRQPGAVVPGSDPGVVFALVPDGRLRQAHQLRGCAQLVLPLGRQECQRQVPLRQTVGQHFSQLPVQQRTVHHLLHGSAGQLLVRGVERAVQLAGHDPLAVAAGVGGPGRVEAGVDRHYLAAARVGPLDRLPGRRGGLPAQPLGLRARDLPHPAVAAPAVRGEVVVPPGVVSPQQCPVPPGVLGAVLFAGTQLVQQVGVRGGGAADPGPLAGGAGGPHVGPEDCLEAAGAAQLRGARVAGTRVDDLPDTPPAGLAQDRLQLGPKRLVRRACRQGPVERRADVVEDVQLHRLGDRERHGVLGTGDVAIIEADPQVPGAEKIQGLGGYRAGESEPGPWREISHGGIRARPCRRPDRAR